MKKRAVKKTVDQEPQREVQHKISAKTENQKLFIRSICENDVTFGLGAAGTGKTIVTIGIACEHLLAGKISRIVVTRPFVEAGRGLGFLKGDLSEKLIPWSRIFDQYFSHFLTKGVYESYKALGVISFEPLEYMRGMSYSGYVILDESQNATYEQLKMLLTRLNADSKAIIIGDEKQTDLKRSDVLTVAQKLQSIDGVGLVQFTEDDICRHDIVGKILRVL
jgi:phosphate starvation-inducible PhoH-like protein